MHPANAHNWDEDASDAEIGIKSGRMPATSASAGEDEIVLGPALAGGGALLPMGHAPWSSVQARDAANQPQPERHVGIFAARR
jgi:hypothetical protein